MLEASSVNNPKQLSLTAAPHLKDASSSIRINWVVIVSLLPSAAWGIILFGIAAVNVLAAAIAAALVAELLATAPFRRFTLHDGSAFLTGLVVGLCTPAGCPLFVPAAASAFAIIIVKQSFGGLGRNFMNPALAGVVFAGYSWPGLVSRFLAPRLAGAEGAAIPPLEALRAAVASSAVPRGSPLDMLGAAGHAFSRIDGSVIGWLNTNLLGPLGMHLSPGSFDILIGNTAGRIGELSVPLLLLGAALLVACRVIRWEIPVVSIASFGVITLVFGGLPVGRGWLGGGAGFHVLNGSLVLGAFFLATDPVTSPITRKGRIVYAVGIGCLSHLLRFYGSQPDGVLLAIILCNCFVPLIDRCAGRRPGIHMARSRPAAARGAEEKARGLK